MIYQILYDLLTSIEEVQATVGDRIYPNVAPQNAKTPYVVTSSISTQDHSRLAGAGELETSRVQIDLYTDTTTLRAEISSFINEHCKWRSYTTHGLTAGHNVRSMTRENQSDKTERLDNDRILFRRMHEYLITYKG